MGIRIITDSTSDISQQDAARLGVLVLPLTVRFGESEYEDGVTIDAATFYEKLTAETELPKTSQVTPFSYQRAFEEALQAGDQVLCITASSGISGCYQSACLAAGEVKRKMENPDDFDSRIVVIDSKQATASEYILVQYAAMLREQGLDFPALAEEMKQSVRKVRLIALLDTLEYLRKGGRISGTAAAFGSLLSIKPFVTFENGVVETIGKMRGSKNTHSHLVQMLENYGGVDFTKPFVVGYAGKNDDFLRQQLEANADIFENHADSVPTMQVGPTIGTYTGPGTIVFGFFSKEN